MSYHDPLDARNQTPVDLVYLWCDSTDPVWANKKDSFWKKEHSEYSSSSNFCGGYCDFDELKFSLRSVAQFAPFIRQIYLITDGQTPKWLKPNARLTIVPLRDLIPKNALYPVFTSLNIESYIHRIDGLSEYFLYANDDMMFGAMNQFSDFMNNEAKITLRFAPQLMGRPNNEEQFYLWACYNSARLIFDSFPLYALGSTTIRTIHEDSTQATVPYFLPGHMIELYSKEICFKAETLLKKAFDTTRMHRFSSNKSYQIPALWKYLALELKAAVGTVASTESLFVSSEHSKNQLRQSFKKLSDRTTVKPKLLCFNNNSTHLNEQWRHYLQTLLPRLYPKPSPFEQVESLLQVKVPRLEPQLHP